MTRVKRGVIALKRRRKVLKAAKGFRWGRHSKERLAREALLHAGFHAFAGRKLKKRVNRRLWQTKISASAKANETSYSKFIGAMRKKNIVLDRKVLSQIAEHYPKAFAEILRAVK